MKFTVNFLIKEEFVKNVLKVMVLMKISFVILAIYYLIQKLLKSF